MTRHSLPWLFCAAFAASVLALVCSGAAMPRKADCVAPSTWVAPGRGRIDEARVLAQMASAQVVLLGENHLDAQHHRWQAHVVRELRRVRPDLVIGLEMLPRRAQPALDAWVRGELGEAEFVERSGWMQAWGTDPELYMGLLRFAREYRVPLYALNVDRALVREVSREGLDAVPADRREGVGRPRPASPAYRDWLRSIWSAHAVPDMSVPAREAQFARFVDSQLLWDRAMAEALAAAGAGSPAPLVVGLMGSGHVRHGHGVGHQLRALGVQRVGTLLPWDGELACTELVPGLADAVFGIEPLAALRP